MIDEKIENTFEIDYDATFQQMREGSVVKGTVVRLTSNDIIIDVGYKSEGAVPREEFSQPNDVKIGDQVDVYLDNLEDDEGRCIVSKRKADRSQGWEKVVQSMSENDIRQARVVRKVKGGLMLDIGIEAFLPASLAFLKGYGSLTSLVGQVIDVKVIKINPQRRNVIVSRKDALEKEKQQSREKVLGELEVGQIRKGTVKNITDFGAFVNLGGIDGLLHITDISWGRISH